MTERLSKSVADDLLGRIAAGEIRPGDRLPTEQSLMAEYGVGRNTVREATQGLRTLGIIEIRPRIGARVLLSRAENALATSAIRALLNNRAIDELNEARLILEPAAASRAAARRTPAQLDAIKLAHARFRAAIEAGADFAEADLDFHQTIAEASGNAVIARLLEPMHDLLLNARRVGATVPGVRERAMREHAAITEAIEQGSRKQARAAMIQHIRTAVWAIEQIKELNDGVGSSDH